jgi:hypothetical protein
MAEPKNKLPQIAQSRLRQRAGAPVDPHPDANALSAFVEQALGSEEREIMLSHLAVCADCREIVALSSPEEDVAVPITTASSGWNWGILRWGAVTAGVVVVAAAALLLNPTAKLRNQPPASQVAKLERQPERLEEKTSPAGSASVASPAAAKSEISGKRQRSTRDEVGRATQGTTNFVREPLVQPKEKKSAPTSDRDNLSASTAKIPPVSRSYADTVSVPAPSPRGAAIGGLLSSAPGGVTQRETNAQSGNRANAINSAPPPMLGANANAEPRNSVNIANQPAVQDLKVPSARNSNAAVSNAQNSENLAKVVKPENAKDESAFDNRAVSAQTVEVTAETPVVQTTSSMVSYKAKAPRVPWRINKEGKLLSRQPDGSWREVPFADNPKFRVLVAPKDTNEIWLGGAQGVLYHSPDNGTTWVPVKGGWPSDAEIVKLKFDDALNGALKTSQKETWTTSDGGKNWQKQ